MTDKEILYKSIEKANKSGYGYNDWVWSSVISNKKIKKQRFLNSIHYQFPEAIIFDPKFGKAFWFGRKCCVYLKSYIIAKEIHEKSIDINRNTSTSYLKWKEDVDRMDFLWIRKKANEIKELGIWQYYQLEMLKEIQEGRNPLKFLEKFL